MDVRKYLTDLTCNTNCSKFWVQLWDRTCGNWLALKCMEFISDRYEGAKSKKFWTFFSPWPKGSLARHEPPHYKGEWFESHRRNWREMVINAGVELALVKRVTVWDKHIYTVTGEGMLISANILSLLKRRRHAAQKQHEDYSRFKKYYVINHTEYSPNELSGSERSLREGTFCMEPRHRTPPAGTQESSGRSCLMAGMALSGSNFCNREHTTRSDMLSFFF